MNYCTKLRVYLRQSQARYYHFPERAVEISKFLVVKANLEENWHKFVGTIEDPFVLDFQIVLNQVDFLVAQIRQVEQTSKELSGGAEDASSEDFSRQKELISYVDHLEGIVTQNKKTLAGSQEEKGTLEVQRSFWECLEKQFNKLFINPISLRNKIQSILKKIEEIDKEKQLEKIENEFKKMEEIEKEKEERKNERELEEVSKLEIEVENMEWQKQQIQVN